MNISKNRIIAGIFAIAGTNFFATESEKESGLELHNINIAKPLASCHEAVFGKKLHCINPPVETPDALNFE